MARLSIGLVLGLVLAVVLHQSNTRDPNLYSNLISQGAFGGTTSAETHVSASTVESAAPEYYICACGGCVSSGFGTMGEWGTPMLNACPTNCDDSSQWPPECFPPSSFSSSVYCCYGPGQPNNCSLQTVCGDGTVGQYSDLASCTSGCPINASSSSCNAVGEVCGGGYGDCCAPAVCDNQSDYGYCVVSSASSEDPRQWCCYQGGCSAFIPSSSAP